MSTFGPNDQRPSSRAALVRPASGMAVLPPPRAVPDLPPESTDDPRWDDHLAREVQHQEVIEASFDRAEAYGRLGDFEHALEWLDRAVVASGGLPTAYRARRARWARAAALRPRPVGRA
jgi:predicted Zn-dependent protease